MRPEGSLPRRGGEPGGSALGGCEEFARGPFALALELGDPLLLARHPRGQRLYLCRQPLILGRELDQHAHHDLAALVIDRPSLDAVHTQKFDVAGLCPPTH